MSRKTLYLHIILLTTAILTLTGEGRAAPGDVINVFPTPSSCPTGLTWDGRYLWLADLKSDSLYAIDPQNGKVMRRIEAPSFRPLGLAYDGNYLWCVDGEEDRLYRIQPQEGLVVRTFESPVSKPTGLAWDGEHLWLASRAAKQIHKISSEDGTTIISFPAPSVYPEGIAFDGKYLWIADRIKNRIYMVSPENGDVINILDAPAPYANGCAFDGKNLWNVDFQTDSLYCITLSGKELYRQKDPKRERIEFTHEVRNYGPGTMKTWDVYLAIPNNYPNQTLLGKPTFSPQPRDIVTDQWGQKVAHYHFENGAAVTITRVAMTVEVELRDTRFFIIPERCGTLDDIPEDIKRTYLVNDEKFDLKNPLIQKIIQEEVGNEHNTYWLMRKIFNAVIKRVDYELSGGWNTAPAVLKRGTGSCSEYTFAFIALCRAAGLPARYTGSVAIRGDDASLDDVFHRWAEVYLPNYGWIPVDPSRGDDPLPEEQAEAIGHWANKYIITTIGGGNSRYMGWTYNSNETWTSSGKCKIYTEDIGEWNPLRGDQ